MQAMPEYKERPGACLACGNSPTHHFATFTVASIGTWGTRLARAAKKRRLLRFFFDIAHRASNSLEQINYYLFHRMRMIRFGHEPARSVSYRSQVVWEEATRRGIPMEQVIFFGSHTDVYRAFINNEWLYFESLPIPSHFPRHAYLWMDDKFLLNETFREAGIPVPPLESVTTEREALLAFERCGGRAVAKPRIGSRARHTTTNIRTQDELRKAFASARQLCRHVCITRHLEGSVCRATVVAGELCGFLEGKPPRLTGDGVATIRTLIERKNAERHERVQPVAFTMEHEDFLSRSGYSLESVLEDGKSIELTHRTGRLFGGETRELLALVHPKLKEYAEKAALLLDVPVVGFDLIIKDPESDPDAQEWGIIEANSLPFIDLHYLPLYGTPSPVAAHVWDLWGTQKPASAGS